MKVGRARQELALDDNLVDDLQLDSLDMIDLVSILEDDFPPAVIDAVIDSVARDPDRRRAGRRFATASADAG